jgi:protein O-GlcNAc transferase
VTGRQDMFERAQALLRAGRTEEALRVAQRLLPRGGGDPALACVLAEILLRLGRVEQAEFHARRALELAPASVPAMVALAQVHQARGRPDEAIALLRRAVEVEPSNPAPRVALANALMDVHDAPGAGEVLREGLARAEDSQLAVSYAGALLTTGHIDEAVAFLEHAVARFPEEPNLVAGLALTLTYQFGADPDRIAAAHRAYGEFMRRHRPAGAVFAQGTRRDPARRLRVGFVSPDLRQHSVAFFAEPIFEHLDRDAFELVAYARMREEDAITRRLRGHFTLWRDVGNLTDLEIARRIHADAIDIAVDLAGHSLGNALPAFALRPAPVQVTYCGYPDTTGLAEMDWRVVDSLTDPPTPEVDARATERLWRLDPCFLCYRPPGDAPDPARDDTHPGPTFGSFNAARKINPGLVALWARILRRVPGARMILKSFDFAAPHAVARVAGEFARQGIDDGRLMFLSATRSLAEHLALYSRIDVALDAFPYCGTTTTCEALWMGVPVVTLAGRTHAGRVGVSLLTNAGAPELVAPDPDAYVEIASTLGTDAARLAAYRRDLRGRLARSALCDAPGFAARFGQALRAMWREYCRNPRPGGGSTPG